MNASEAKWHWQLLENVVKFWPSGKSRLEVAVDATKREYILTVTDTGIGIAEQDQKQPVSTVYTIRCPVGPQI